MSAAATAFETWGKTTPSERQKVLLKLADAIEAHSDEWTGFVMTPQSSFNPLSRDTLTKVHRTG